MLLIEMFLQSGAVADAGDDDLEIGRPENGMLLERVVVVVELLVLQDEDGRM